MVKLEEGAGSLCRQEGMILPINQERLTSE